MMISDVLTGSGYTHRVPELVALPLRGIGASLVLDLHANDRGTQGTFAGAILANVHCYRLADGAVRARAAATGSERRRVTSSRP